MAACATLRKVAAKFPTVPSVVQSRCWDLHGLMRAIDELHHRQGISRRRQPASPRKTKISDRTNEEITLDEVERNLHKMRS